MRNPEIQNTPKFYSGYAPATNAISTWSIPATSCTLNPAIKLLIIMKIIIDVI